MEVDKDTGGVRHNKAEQYLPKIPMLNFEKMVSRSSEINYWTEFVEGISSWLALLDDFYPVELYRASITKEVVLQNSLEKRPAARSARFHNLLKQSLGTFQRGLDVVRQAEQQQLGAACGYEAFRRLNLEFGIQSRMEASAIREAVLGYRPARAQTEEETPQGSTAALGGFANHLTGLLRAALSNRAWSTVTSKSPASQKANSDSDSPVDHGKESPQLVATDETPWIEEVETPAVFVKAAPERTKGPQLSITEPKVARSKARPPPPVLPDREVSRGPE